jgi:uncharacterized protein YecE (DUF72 family)
MRSSNKSTAKPNLAEGGQFAPYDFDFDAAQRLAPNIRFGTSTWTYPGWRGIIYKRQYKSEKAFKAESLGEYATFPLFRTVGIDSSFYKPPSQKLLEDYAALVPNSFPWVSKVWEHLTIAHYPKHARYGQNAGKENPDFLNPELFIKSVLKAYTSPLVLPHVGPFVFQFPTFNDKQLTQEAFLEKLQAFFQKLPGDFKYAVELRNPRWLNDNYFSTLNDCAVTHCFNHWYIMPPLREQMTRAAKSGGLKAPFFVARILTPLGIKYEDAVKLFQPYSTIKQPNDVMRHDIVTFMHRAIERNTEAFIIVNNRAEGNAPMTIDSILRLERLSTQ